MKFSELLSKYCDDLSCSNIELSRKANLNPSLISRLKRGMLGYNVADDVVSKISDALLEISSEKTLDKIPEDIYQHLIKALIKQKEKTLKQEQTYANNFDFLILQLKIKNNHLARFFAVDPSYISRIRKNERKPYNSDDFVQKFSRYLLKFYFQEKDITLYSKVFEIEKNLITEETFLNHLGEWLISSKDYKKNAIENFLKSVDNYEIKELVNKEALLNEVENSFLIPKAKRYYGVEETKQATLDFYISVLKSSVPRDIIIYNDFPLDVYWADRTFIKKWLFYMQLAIEKGNRIYKIHYLNETLETVLEEIKVWLPFYMSGHVKPYYLEKGVHTVSSSLLFVAKDLVAVVGESSASDNKIMTRLTKKQDEVNYYFEKGNAFLKVGKPLAKIYFKEDEEEYENHLQESSGRPFSYLRIINMPPNFTMTEKFLDSLLEKNNLDNEFKSFVKKRTQKRNDAIHTFLQNYEIFDVLSTLSEEEFKLQKRQIIIARGTLGKNIYYTYQDYLQHLALTKKYATDNPNYNVFFSNKFNYENLEFYIRRETAVVVEKTNDPIVTIIFENKKIIKAFEEEILHLISK